VGNHELIITRDHTKNFAELSFADAKAVFMVLQKRHEVLGADPCNSYVSSFANWGREAGASLSHPHYQILALPIVPPHASKSTGGASRYFKKHGRCVRCEIVRVERKAKVRVIAENKEAIALSLFAAKRPFEITILPKRHESYFTKTPAGTMGDVAALLQLVMRRIKKYLGDPDLNFFIHDAPSDGRDHSYHHWHVGVVPVNVVSPPGGFEVSTIVNINVIDPEKAAAILRGKPARK
jgi:UDPglucose--hexose-1-phosphate uridylyltransferase